MISSNLQADEFSRHKLLASYMFNSISRATLTRNESYAAPVGYAIEYSMFLGKNLALTGQFNLSLEPVAQSVFFMGGGAALTWYIMGGANTNYSDDYFQISSEPGFNLIFVGGMAARQFDFSSADQRLVATTGEPIIYDKKDKPSNSFFGPLFGLGIELPVGFFLTPGFRIQMVSSFESTDSPSITSMEVWFYSAFVL